MNTRTGANGERLVDENHDLRHHKRGMLSMYYNGDSQNGTKFMITLDNAETLNGYNQVIGELVQGDEVLHEVEKSLERSG